LFNEVFFIKLDFRRRSHSTIIIFHTITTHRQKKPIRLVGIDTPEKSRKKNEPGQPYSQKATKYLAGMVLNQEVSIEDYGKDRYGRILGVIYAGKTNVNLEKTMPHNCR